MSLSYLRDAINKRFQQRVDAAGNKAINMRVNVEVRADGYALVQADTLAEARAFAEAIKIVTDEYKRLTEATTDKQPESTEKKAKDQIYG